MSDSKQNLVIAGNGMVGQKLIDLLIEAGALERYVVTVIGEEPRPAYDRVALSSYFDGATEEDLRLVNEDARSSGVDYRHGVLATQINRTKRLLETSDGNSVAYDHLVLATGSYPFVPPIDGRDREGCFVYRTIDDLEAIAARAAGSMTGVVIGGGLLGLEAANALRLLGLRVHVIEMAPSLMPQQLDSAGGEMLRRWITDFGVEVHCDAVTSAIDGDDSGVTAIRLDDGAAIDAQLVVFSAGIRPRDELARNAGINIGERGGVVVDDLMHTADPTISAIGEVACHRGTVYGLVAPGYDMARTLVRSLMGDDSQRFRGTDLSAKLKLLGVDVASFCQTQPTDSTHTELVFSDPLTKVHRRLLVDSSSGRLLGGSLVGDASNYQLLRLMALGEMETPDQVSSLVLPESIGAAETSSVGLPDAALVCSCNAVTAGDLRQAVRAGCQSVGALKSETTAGTGCAGCVPTVKTLLDTELGILGVEVDASICEHFGYSRQELFDLIKFHKHRTWQAVLDAHGSGLGCDVCRPTVASILASSSGSYILDGDQAAIQDTNDHALANMQRNGTYSVVPRVPGGEITPAQLIALGEIADEYGLYTKITGAQRIDMFGAQLHQLPSIWEKVIAAGLESGHAYGKALRTVKSCVGTTWCRYGVQDSVGMAIRLERRYRGIRSPHKLKSAVSGCTRECAEAQSKDFGVIATENGWNLYVCGNGGKNPRHGELFATDLDDETLIRYVDRFVMFYIRTADKLQRTSTWFESLEGGIDYLRSVIIDDALGICEELEADMVRHCENYRCEWTETLESPERMAHFIEFVNAPEMTSQPVWIETRGQRTPAAKGTRPTVEVGS